MSASVAIMSLNAAVVWGFLGAGRAGWGRARLPETAPDSGLDAFRCRAREALGCQLDRAPAGGSVRARSVGGRRVGSLCGRAAGARPCRGSGLAAIGVGGAG